MINKKEHMQVIRDHCTTDEIKNSFQTSINEFDFQKQKSGLKSPNVVCRSENSTKVISKYFNINQYVAGRATEFIRTVGEYLVSMVTHTKRKVLLNYLPYKHFELQCKNNNKRKYLCAILVAKHFAESIAIRRAEWVRILIYNYQKIRDLAISILARQQFTNEKDQKEALLGMKCHQRGVEPYFLSTAFSSGKGYDYSVSKEKTNIYSVNENISLDRNDDNGNEKPSCPKGKNKSKQSRNTKKSADDDVIKSNLYECTDDCIDPTDEDYDLYSNFLYTISITTPKDIRNVLDKCDYCSNMPQDDIYLLPCEKRNHPKKCYEKGCESSSVIIRKLAIHHKNCRAFMEKSINLNMAHKFLHDIDVATVLGDIEYLIKLLALTPAKQPSVFNGGDFPQKSFDNHIATYKINCQDLPDIICQSCYILERKKNIRQPKVKWIHINNDAWKSLKKNAENYI